MAVIPPGGGGPWRSSSWAGLAAAAGVAGWVLAAGAHDVVVAQPAETFHQVSITKVAPAPCAPAASCRSASAAHSVPSSITLLPEGRFEARNQTIENLARVAFGFEGTDPTVGVVAESKFSSPHADRFDIDAVADRPWTPAPRGETVPDEFRDLLRRLLRERFKLQARVAVTDVDVLGLQLTRADRERGPGLRRSSRACSDPSARRRDDDARPVCGFRVTGGGIEATAVTIGQFAAWINDADDMRMDRFIVDQTGLSGLFDITLSLNPKTRDRREALRQAMRMQLGLKFVKARVPLPTLILEHAEAPVED